MQYALVIRQLNEEDGGGYEAFFPDLPGCMADGESPSEAAANALDALDCWLSVQNERGAPIPEPESAAVAGHEYVTGLLEEIDRLRSELDAAKAEARSARRFTSYALAKPAPRNLYRKERSLQAG
jgi:antitoxin HicB